jgi:hypothetical protein
MVRRSILMNSDLLGLIVFNFLKGFGAGLLIISVVVMSMFVLYKVAKFILRKERS